MQEESLIEWILPKQVQTKEWAPQLHLDLLGDVGGAETSSRAAEATED